jgi:hypothetical protein
MLSSKLQAASKFHSLKFGKGDRITGVAPAAAFAAYLL